MTYFQYTTALKLSRMTLSIALVLVSVWFHIAAPDNAALDARRDAKKAIFIELQEKHIEEHGRGISLSDPVMRELHSLHGLEEGRAAAHEYFSENRNLFILLYLLFFGFGICRWVAASITITTLAIPYSLLGDHSIFAPLIASVLSGIFLFFLWRSKLYDRDRPRGG